MLTFHTVRYKNILSTGNAFTEVQLDRNKSTLIVGENGAGKSTMLDAICFALYGKAFRKITKNQLINSINGKGLLVELEFTVQGKRYLVRRGIKPAVFEIHRDGELIDQQASARDYQGYFEEQILKMNYKSFGQIVVLGSSTFVPFMQLSSIHRREIIEDLLDIQIFTVMNSMLKDDVGVNKEALSNARHDNSMLTQQIDSAIEHNESIKKIRQFELDKIKGKVKEQLTYIEGEQQAVDICGEQIDDLLSSISDKASVNKKVDEIRELETKLNTKASHLKKDIAFFNKHDNCPTCQQDIDTAFKESKVEGHNKTTLQIEEAFAQLEKRKDGLMERAAEIKAVEKDINEINLQASGHRANIKLAKSTLNQFKRDMEQAQQEVDEIDDEKIKTLQQKLEEGRRQEKNLAEQKQLLSLAASLLKDGGIKSQIIKQYVPVMNKLINKYLAAMDFFVQFELDESFNETIRSRFRDVFSYSSFSEGEKLRIDLALLFTWRAVSKLRNSVSTNLLIMDEIMDSSLDNSGTEEFLKIINDLAENSNIFIISHKGDSLHDKFEHMIRFQKVKNFSQIADAE